MNDAAVGHAEIGDAIARGDIVLLRCATKDTGGIEQARESSRRATAWLHTVAGCANVRVSRSATSGLGLVAAHRERVVGIDVEQANAERVFDGIANTLLHRDEFDEVFGMTLGSDTLAHVWVRKEATLKAFGVGLAAPPNSIITGAYNEQWRAVNHGILGAALVRSVQAPDGFAVAVAMLGATTATISVFDFE